MDDYVPPGYIRLSDHIEDVARGINAEIVDGRPTPELIKAELERAHQSYLARNEQDDDASPKSLETLADFAGPFLDGRITQGVELVSLGATSSQFIRHRVALDAVAGKLDERRAPIMEIASRQVRDELCTGKLQAMSTTLEPLDAKFWMAPAAARFFDMSQPDVQGILLKAEDEPKDDGERQFFRFLEERYEALYLGIDKLTIFDAFKKTVTYGPTAAAMKRAWDTFSKAHPDFSMSVAGAKSKGKSPRKSNA